MKLVNYKHIILFAIISIVPYSFYGQIINQENHQKEYLQIRFDSIHYYEINLERIYDDLLSGFYDFQKNNPEYGNMIIKKVLNDDFLSDNYKHLFLLNFYDSFNNNQKQKIKIYLNNNLNPNDDYYYLLVSYYKLSEQIDFLKTHIEDSLFYYIRLAMQKNGIVDNNLEFQLKNLSTLTDLEMNRQMEDSLLNNIHSLYSFVKFENKKNLKRFYHLVFSNVFPFLNSKNSVIKSMYMLDETEFSPSQFYDDVVNFGYAFDYFNEVIRPKVKENSLFKNSLYILNSEDLQRDKEKIKQLILHDDSIWKDYIRK